MFRIVSHKGCMALTFYGESGLFVYYYLKVHSGSPCSMHANSVKYKGKPFFSFI